MWQIFEKKNTCFGPSTNIKFVFCLEKDSQASQRRGVEKSCESKSVVSLMRVCIVVQLITFIGLEAMLHLPYAKHTTPGA